MNLGVKEYISIASETFYSVSEVCKWSAEGQGMKKACDDRLDAGSVNGALLAK